MRIPVFLQHLISRLFGKLCQTLLIRLRQHHIFIRSPLRCFSVIEHQRYPIAGSRFYTTFTYCYLREVLFKLYIARYIIPYSIRNQIRMPVILPVVPICFFFRRNGSQLEYSSFCWIIMINVLNVRAKGYDGISKEMIRNPRTVRAVVLIMFMQLHTKITILTFLRKSSGKRLIRIQHFFHSGKSIHIQHFRTQLVKRQMNGSSTRNPVPVESVFLPATRCKGYSFSRLSSQHLHAAITQVSSVEIGIQVMLGIP